MRKLFQVILSIVLFVPAFSLAQDVKNLYFDVEVGIVEHLNDTIPADIILIDENGKKVNLRELIDKPTVLMFVYFRCPGICTPLMDGVAEVIEKSNLELAKDYQVLSISFDPHESPELAVKKKRNYQSLIKGQNTKDGWLFFTADSANIARATQAVGFRYKTIGTEYLHAATLVLLSPGGKITRYLNGTYFLPFEFKLAVLEASKGQSGPTINKILQYCYSYDPVGQAYVLNITKVTGTLIILMALVVFLILIIKKPRRKTQP